MRTESIIEETNGEERKLGLWALRYPGGEQVTFYFKTIEEACAYLIDHPCTRGEMNIRFKANL